MKKLLIILLFTGIVSPAVVLAGGIVTNANQSAAYVRMLARDASTSIDAVYYNPAGITKLADGFHLSLSNQSLFQKKTIENKFPKLKESKYVGDVAAPLFPDLYAVYKKGKLAIGFGFQPNSGGGSADYKTGLPSFEIPFSMIPASLSSGLTPIPTTDYSVSKISFKGSSVFWGAQLNAAYAINDMISVSAGLRYIYAVNTYEGEIKGIMINPQLPANTYGFDGTMRAASSVFHTLSVNTAAAAEAPAGVGGLTAGYPTSTLSDLVGVAIDAATAQKIANTLGIADYTTSTLTMTQIKAGYLQKAAYLEGNSAATSDQVVDSKQTGTGYTPILGLNLTFGEKLNIGIKYEFNTKLTLKNSTAAGKEGIGGVNPDGTLIYMFPDKLEIRSDIPAILSVGLGYKVMPKMKVSAGMHYYFDKNATIEKAPGVKKDIEGNLYEIALGGEYDITDKILISAGYLYAKTGVGQGYQTDLSHSLTSSTVGFGGAFMVNEKMQLNLGMLYTMYQSDSKDIDYSKYGIPSAQEVYNRTNLGFSIGVDYHF